MTILKARGFKGAAGSREEFEAVRRRLEALVSPKLKKQSEAAIAKMRRDAIVPRHKLIKPCRGGG
ncbi:MAG: hypothetical protein WCV69_04225 [Patescibacteria group bacterium]|jgi:hypothetical protein